MTILVLKSIFKIFFFFDEFFLINDQIVLFFTRDSIQTPWSKNIKAEKYLKISLKQFFLNVMFFKRDFTVLSRT